MNQPRSPLALRHLLTAVAATLVSSSYPIHSLHAQGKADSAGATTLTSKQKVNIIVDRERTDSGTILLLKIMVPEEAKVESFTLSNPARIVVDFVGVSVKTSENLVPPKNGVIKLIRLGAHADKLRIVMDLATETPPQYEWRGTGRQAILRIVETGSVQNAPAPAAPAATQPAAQPITPPAAQAPEKTIVEPPAPTKAPAPTAVEQPKKEAPPVAATSTPTNRPTLTPTVVPTRTPTSRPTNVPTLPPTAIPTAASTSTPTSVPTPPPAEKVAQKTEPKLPDMNEKELEEALDKEVARATEALERGEELPENVDLEGEDLVDVPAEEIEDTDLSEQKESTTAQTGSAPKGAAIVTKDLPTGTSNQAAPANTDAISGLRANPIPAAPVTDFTIQSAEFSYLEPEHKEAFRLTLSRPGAQAQMSKVDPTTYKIVIPKCGLANLGLALPQYPTADFKGLSAVTAKVEGETVEITAQVEQGVSLTTLIRDREVWIKRQ